MTRLTIDNQTSLKTVADFMAQQKGKAEVLAKKNENGETVLYTRKTDGAKNVFKTMKDFVAPSSSNTSPHRLSEKRSLAQQTIADLVRNFGQNKLAEIRSHQDPQGFGKVSVEKLEQLFNAAPQNIKTFNRTAETVSNSFNALMTRTDKIANMVQTREGAGIRMDPFPPTTNRELAGSTTLTDKNGMHAVCPDLQIDGKTFTAKTVLGVGGNGRVVRYENDEGKSVAVKLPTGGMKHTTESFNLKALQEFNNARLLTDQNPNAIGFGKYVPLGDGTMALVGDLAPNGDFSQLSQKLKDITSDSKTPSDKIPKGNISQNERKLIALTMIRDTAAGLDKIANDHGMTHGDMKSQNVMISADGTGQIIDLGDAIKFEMATPKVIEGADAPLYRGPEWAKMKDFVHKREQKTTGESATKSNLSQFKAMAKMVFDSFGITQKKVGTDTFDTKQKEFNSLGVSLANDLREAALIENSNGLTLTAKYDMFGLGTAAFELFVGERVTAEKIEAIDTGFASDHEFAIRDWADSGANAIGPDGLTSKSSGFADVDGLLNGMLAGDPANRMDFKAVMGHSTMDHKAIGSPELRNLIVAVTSGTPDDIDTARKQLADKFGPI